MDFRPIVAPSIRELFIQQLEGAILSGQLKPGDRLPTERELPFISFSPIGKSHGK